MKADRASVSWDEQKNKWLVRIVVGEEVIRRYCDDARTVERGKLVESALRTAADEGYELTSADVAIS